MKNQDFDEKAPLNEDHSGVQVLLSEGQWNLAEEDQVYYAREVIKVLGLRGVRSLLTRVTPYYPMYSRVTYHALRILRNGEWTNREIRPQLTQKKLDSGTQILTLIVEDIRVGDIFEWSVSIAGLASFLKDTKISRFFHFESHEKSTDISFFRVVFNPKNPISTKVLHGQVDRTEENINSELKAYSWIQKSTKPVSEPHWSKGNLCVQISQFQNWNEVAQQNLPQYTLPKDFNPSQEMKDLVARWIALPDILQQATAATRFVQDEIIYFSIEGSLFGSQPDHPNDTLRKRQGCCRDKVFLLHAFFHLMGIPSSCVLVNTNGFEHREKILPMRSFGHVLLKASIKEEEYWIETTHAMQGGSLKKTSQLTKQWGLVLNSKTTDIVSIPLPPFEKCPHQRFVTFKYTSPTMVKLVIKTLYFDVQADSMRYQWHNEGCKTLTKQRLEALPATYGKVKSHRFMTIQDDREKNEFTTTERYDLALNEKGGRGLHCVLSVQNFLSNQIDPEARSLHFSETITVINPYNKLPDSSCFEIENTNFSYKQSCIRSTAPARYSWSFEFTQKKETEDASNKNAYMQDIQRIRENLPQVKIKRQDTGSRFFHYLFKGLWSLLEGLWRFLFWPRKA
ncbi:MAG: DUF3857 domain-containing protein [Verrucomicrobia bacterium]|nr:DUF3857 domain-containing protein [Verrucomicrobiota bacterium]